MTKRITSVLLCVLLAFAGPALSQRNVVVKHRASALAFVRQTSATNNTSASAISSSAITVTAGDLIVVFCFSGNGGSTGTVTSSPANTFTDTGLNGQIASSFGTVNIQYSFSSTGGSTTTTCTFTASTGLQAIAVLIYHPGFLTALDVAQHGLGVSQTPTSNSFSTAARGLIVNCAMYNAAGGWTAGLIGSATATLRVNNASNGISVGCEDTLPSASQTTITAAMSNAAASAQWLLSVGAFK